MSSLALTPKPENSPTDETAMLRKILLVSLAERSEPGADPCVRLLARRWMGFGWRMGSRLGRRMGSWLAWRMGPRLGCRLGTRVLAGGGAARAGVGVDRATSWRPGFMEAAVSFDDSCQVHGVHAGFW
jgi:hypothetical protein